MSRTTATNNEPELITTTIWWSEDMEVAPWDIIEPVIKPIQNRLDILPEDCLRIIWSKVFDNCIKDIPTAAFNHYEKSYTKYCTLFDSIDKQIDRQGTKIWNRSVKKLGDAEMKLNILKYEKERIINNRQDNANMVHHFLVEHHKNKSMKLKFTAVQKDRYKKQMKKMKESKYEPFNPFVHNMKTYRELLHYRLYGY